MYTTKEQSIKLIDAGIEINSADMMVVAAKGKDPFKTWNPIPKSLENLKKYEGKDMMPSWSDEALILLLPKAIKDPNTIVTDNTGMQVPLRYEFAIGKRTIPARGKFFYVSYSDLGNEHLPHAGFLAKNLTTALVDAIIEILCKQESNIINYEW